MTETPRTLLIREAPRDIKVALMNAAEQRESNVQAMAVGILAEEFGVPYVPGRSKANAADVERLTLNLRMPPELHKRIRIKAAELGCAHSDLALIILGKHLGIDIDPERLNRRRGRKAA